MGIAMTANCWKLDGHHPVRCSFEEWGEFIARPLEEARRVAYTEVGGHCVDTTFLAADCRFGLAGPPLFFETMVFSGDNVADEIRRYSTWDEAVAGHEAIVGKLTQ